MFHILENYPHLKLLNSNAQSQLTISKVCRNASAEKGIKRAINILINVCFDLTGLHCHIHESATQADMVFQGCSFEHPDEVHALHVLSTHLTYDFNLNSLMDHVKQVFLKNYEYVLIVLMKTKDAFF